MLIYSPYIDKLSPEQRCVLDAAMRGELDWDACFVSPQDRDSSSPERRDRFEKVRPYREVLECPIRRRSEFSVWEMAHHQISRVLRQPDHGWELTRRVMKSLVDAGHEERQLKMARRLCWHHQPFKNLRIPFVLYDNGEVPDFIMRSVWGNKATPGSPLMVYMGISWALGGVKVKRGLGGRNNYELLGSDDVMGSSYSHTKVESVLIYPSDYVRYLSHKQWVRMTQEDT